MRREGCRPEVEAGGGQREGVRVVVGRGGGLPAGPVFPAALSPRTRSTRSTPSLHPMGPALSLCREAGLFCRGQLLVSQGQLGPVGITQAPITALPQIWNLIRGDDNLIRA